MAWLTLTKTAEASGLTRPGLITLAHSGQIRTRVASDGRWEFDTESLQQYTASLPPPVQAAHHSRARLLALLELLHIHDDWTMRQFAAALRVNQRQVERYFRDLRLLGYNITWIPEKRGYTLTHTNATTTR